jgi:hypothetical protein
MPAATAAAVAMPPVPSLVGAAVLTVANPAPAKMSQSHEPHCLNSVVMRYIFNSDISNYVVLFKPPRLAPPNIRYLRRMTAIYRLYVASPREIGFNRVNKP